MTDIDFKNLNITELRTNLLSQVSYFANSITTTQNTIVFATKIATLANQWQLLQHANIKQYLAQYPTKSYHSNNHDNSNLSNNDDILEYLKVEWLINIFNQTFMDKNVILVRGDFEPEYFPATNNQPARIQFAHGFFSSALHEISHWSIAGTHRRTLPDFGYWYAPDGRTEKQQQAFEKVEIKPQAIECLLTLMTGKNFNVSQDNLNANYDTSASTFKTDVFNQAQLYIQQPQALPKDALQLLTILALLCQDT